MQFTTYDGLVVAPVATPLSNSCPPSPHTPAPQLSFRFPEVVEGTAQLRIVKPSITAPATVILTPRFAPDPVPLAFDPHAPVMKVESFPSDDLRYTTLFTIATVCIEVELSVYEVVSR